MRRTPSKRERPHMPEGATASSRLYTSPMRRKARTLDAMLSLRLVLAAAVLAACAVSFSTSARAEGTNHSGYFKTPSGSIYCDYLYGSRVIAKYRYVRCGFTGKLSPPEPR